MNDKCAQRDLVKDTKTMWLLWVLPVATILISGYFANGGWVMTVSWTLSLVVMGVGCVANARGCGRMHCYFTGPFFLLMAVVSFAHGLQLLPLGPRGWSYIGTTLLVGGILLCVVPEQVWGRYHKV